MKLVPATSDDAPYLAAILFRAFAEDLLLIGTCYPDTPANRGWWAKRIASQMQHANTRVTKVIDDATGVIVAWAKWLVYRPGAEKGTGAVNPEVEPSKDTNLEACRKLADGQYKMLEAVMGQRGYICESHCALETHSRLMAGADANKHVGRRAERYGYRSDTSEERCSDGIGG